MNPAQPFDTAQDEMPMSELPSEPAFSSLSIPSDDYVRWRDYGIALRAHCERLVEENKQHQADFDAIFQRMENHTNHRPVCNADHRQPLGGDMCICVPVRLRAAIKRAESAESQLAALREGRAELVKRLLDNSCGSEERDEMLLETGKMTGLGVPKEVGEAIILWNDLLREAAAALKDGSGG